MSNLDIDSVFIVGAGFSRHAGLPLTNGFIAALHEAREHGEAPSRVLIEFLSAFIHDAFGHSKTAHASKWPDLEDVFTCVDLSANTGHYLRDSFSPADLRTVRRTMLSLIIRMLHRRYESGRRRKDAEWRRLDTLFWSLDARHTAFISMNWDTVIERKLALVKENPSIDYCCDALAAWIPEPLDRDMFATQRSFMKAFRQGHRVSVAALSTDRRQMDFATPIVKIHGSSNWLYCDNCRKVFWFHPDESLRIAAQLIREDDLSRMHRFLGIESRQAAARSAAYLPGTRIKCVCSNDVSLGTRIATFSYRKALDFPMFQKSWLAAEDILRSARRWVFIGYSLPAADFEFKYLLKRTQLSRRRQPEFVVISGGNKVDVRRTFDNYRKFFGDSVRSARLFPDGLTSAAITAACS